MVNVKRFGEGHIPKNHVPTKAELASCVEELVNSVKGAMKARIQLGFEEVKDEEWNLKPIIKRLQDEVGGQITPNIIKTAKAPSRGGPLRNS